MSRILFVSAAIAPTTTLAHVGARDPGRTGTPRHSVSHADHLLPLIAALMPLIAAAVLIWARQS